MTIDRHIFLIGMQNCGKSSLGKRLAQRMGFSYVDTDLALADAVGMTEAEILVKYGEAAWHNGEKNILQSLVLRSPCMISTGGDMPLDEENRKIMRNHGITILIDRPIESIMTGIRMEKRPMFQVNREDIPDVYRQRIDTYRAAADLVMDNSHGFQNGLNTLEYLITSELRRLSSQQERQEENDME